MTIVMHEPLAGSAPQSLADVLPIVAALQQMDPRLGVRWEPKAVMVRRGSYDAMGVVIDPVYRGLWEIALYDKAFGTAEWRAHTRVCFVTRPMKVGGVPAMAQDGEYFPLCDAVVTFMREIDRYNNDAANRFRQRLDAMNDADDERALRAGDDATEEAASKQYFAGTKAGGGVSEFHPVRVQLTR